MFCLNGASMFFFRSFSFASENRWAARH
uniref:Uncharacterized protein n=1 Tax=Arundo donax TaxID=35708 RepID=A0A0A9FMQ8_ARUDO